MYTYIYIYIYTYIYIERYIYIYTHIYVLHIITMVRPGLEALVPLAKILGDGTEDIARRDPVVVDVVGTVIDVFVVCAVL